MSEDFYRSEGGRDGYRSQRDNNGNGGRQYGHTPRPRITRNARPEGSNTYEVREQQGGYRPRFGGDNGYRSNGGYQPRSGYQQPRENRWAKTRFNQTESGYQEQRGGYRPRFGGQAQPNEAAGGYTQDARPKFRGGSKPGGYGSRFQGQGAGAYGANSGRPQPRKKPKARPKTSSFGKKRVDYKEEVYDPTMPLRLNKFLANAGVCSRRDADKYIEAGVVSVNGQIVTELGAKVLRTDEVRFHDNLITMEKKVYVLLNKPKGYVTTSDDPQQRKTVMDLVQNACPERIYPVGRLDRNTTGVLLLTNDGELASRLTHPKFLKKKIYHVTLNQNVAAADLKQIAEGVMLEDGEIRADAVEYAHPTDKKQVGIEIHSGKNRIVRRLFEHLGYHVTKLDRVYFAGLTKKNVRRSDWRYLSEKEVQMLRMGAFE